MASEIKKFTKIYLFKNLINLDYDLFEIDQFAKIYEFTLSNHIFLIIFRSYLDLANADKF